MATFTFGRTVDIHWNGFEVVGPAGTVFSIPDQLYEEFNDDIFPVEPTLTWIDTNEFLTLSNSVSVSTLEGTIPISITTTTSGRNVAISSTTNPAGYNLVADGTGGVIFQAGSTGALTSIVGVSPMSTIIVGSTASVILNANYQTAGTYVTGVVGTSPISASGTTAITVTIDQAAITGATAATNAQVVRFLVKNTTGTTIPKGSAVYVSGATGDNALISLASATSDPTSSKTLGITAESIANDAFGYVIEAGYLTDIDTSATTAGAAVWLGNTPGSLVFVTPPAEPSHSVYLGVVVRVQSNNGSILVKVQNGYELDELHDVFVGGVSTALPLVYSSTSSGWVAQALTSVGIADNAIVAAKINAGAVGSAALADNAVVAAKINAGAVGTVAISSGSATSGQILQANGSGGASFTTLAGAGAFGGTVADIVWTAGTASNTTYAAEAAASWGVSGGGTQIYSVSPTSATGSRTIKRFNLDSASTAASTSIALSIAGTASDIVTGGYGFASGTAMVYAENVGATTTGLRTITLRKFNDTLTTNMWNTTIVSGVNQNRFTAFAFTQSGINYESSIGIWYSWDQRNVAEAGTSLVYVVNDASGSVYTAPFFVNSATETGAATFAVYVPPSGAGDGTIYAWGTSKTETGSTVSYHRIAYTTGSASITAASTVTSNYGFPAMQQTNNLTQDPFEQPSSGWWDAASTAIVLKTKVQDRFGGGLTTVTTDMIGLDRTAGTLLFRSVQHSGTVLRVNSTEPTTNVFDPVTRLHHSQGGSAHCIYKIGQPGEFYQPLNFAVKYVNTQASLVTGWMGFAGAGSAEYALRSASLGGSSIITQKFSHNLVDVELLAASDKGRLVFHDANLSDRWRPVSLSAGSSFAASPFIGSINYSLAAATGLAGYTNGDFPLYLPANTPLTATFSRVVAGTAAGSAATQPAGTAKFALKVIQLA